MARHNSYSISWKDRVYTFSNPQDLVRFCVNIGIQKHFGTAFVYGKLYKFDIVDYQPTNFQNY